MTDIAEEMKEKIKLFVLQLEDSKAPTAHASSAQTAASKTHIMELVLRLGTKGQALQRPFRMLATAHKRVEMLVTTTLPAR